MKKRHRLLTSVLVSVAVFAVSMVVSSWIVLANVYPVPKPVEPDLDTLPAASVVMSQSGSRMAKGIFAYGGPDLVVIFHGNGGTVNSEMETARRFHATGRSVLLVEYPGYGMSMGYPVGETEMVEDAGVLIRLVQRGQKISPAHTMLYGRSLGAALAVEMAHQKQGSKLVLVTPFSRMVDMVSSHGAPAFLAPLMTRDPWDNLAKAPELECPALVIVAAHDPVAAPTMGRALAKALPFSRLRLLDSSNHATVYTDFDESLWQEILAF